MGKKFVSNLLYKQAAEGVYSFGSSLVKKVGKASSADANRPSDRAPAVCLLNTPRIAEAPSKEQFCKDHEVKDNSVEDQVPEEFTEDHGVKKQLSAFCVEDNLRSDPVPNVNVMDTPRIAEAPSKEQFCKDLEVKDNFSEDQLEKDFSEDHEVKDFSEDQDTEEFTEDHGVEKQLCEDHAMMNQLSVDDNLPSAPVLNVNPMNIPRIAIATLTEDELKLPLEHQKLLINALENPDVLVHDLSILFKKKKDNSWAVTPLVT